MKTMLSAGGIKEKQQFSKKILYMYILPHINWCQRVQTNYLYKLQEENTEEKWTWERMKWQVVEILESKKIKLLGRAGDHENDTERKKITFYRSLRKMSLKCEAST